jgi:hypothetical protein
MNMEKPQEQRERNDGVSTTVYWTQNNCELRKCHSKRGEKMERARGEHDGQQSA